MILLLHVISMTNTESTVWEYNWHIHYSPILLRILAVALGLLSFFSFLGVISTMSGVSNASSAYYLAVHNGNPSFEGVLIFIMITMGYAVYTSLWALFQMQFNGMMHLVPHRTSAVCLSFNSRMCARLAAPMAFFYLGENRIHDNMIQKQGAAYHGEIYYIPLDQFILHFILSFFLPCILPFFLHCFLLSFLIPFFLSFLPSFPSFFSFLLFLSSFLPTFFPSFLPSLASFLPSFLSSFFPSFLPSFLPSFPSYLL